MVVSILEVDVKAQAFDDFVKKFEAFQKALGTMAPAWAAAGKTAAATTVTLEAGALAAERTADASAAHQATTEKIVNATARPRPSNAPFAPTGPAAPAQAAAAANTAAAAARTASTAAAAAATAAAAAARAAPRPAAPAAGGAGGGGGAPPRGPTPAAPGAPGSPGAPPPAPGANAPVTPAQAAAAARLAAALKKKAEQEEAQRKKDQAKLDKKAEEDAQRAAERLRETTKQVAANIKDATGNLLKWIGISGIVGGLLGGAAGLLGLEHLAGSANQLLRSSQGLGTTGGNQQAFGLNFGPTVDPSFLGNVADAQSDLTKRYVFGHLGISQAVQRGDSADLAAATLSGVKDLVDKQNKQPGGLSQQWADANGLTTALGLSMADLRRIGTQSKAQINAEEAGYQTDKGTFNLPPATLAVWQKLDVQLNRAGTTIEDIFIRGLAPLAGPLTDLSKSVTDVVASLLNNKGLAGSIEWLSGKVEEFAQYLASPSFVTDIHNFEAWIGQLAAAVGRAYTWIAHVLPGLGLPALSAPSGGDGSGGNAPGAVPITGRNGINAAALPPLVPYAQNVARGQDPAAAAASAAAGGMGQPGATPADLGAPIFNVTNPIFNPDGSPANSAAWVQTWKKHAAAMSLQKSQDTEIADAVKNGVNPAFAAAIFKNEGGLNPDGTPRVSRTGAMGAGQLEGATAIGLGVNPLDNASNIDGATRYMAQLLTKYNGDPDKAAAAYNWGAGNLDNDINGYTDKGGVYHKAEGANWRDVLPDETKTYITNVDSQMKNPNAALAAAVAALAARTKQAAIVIHNQTGGSAVVTAQQLQH
jgi:hypothetical protein